MQLSTPPFDLFRRLDKATTNVIPYGIANNVLIIFWSYSNWRVDLPLCNNQALVALAEIADILEE